MKIVKANEIDYEVITDYRDGYDEEMFLEKCTDYFNEFDYIVGDWAYNKLRLKGFYDKKNSKCGKYNNIDELDSYLKNNCAYGCKYFVVKKVNERI